MVQVRLLECILSLAERLGKMVILSITHWSSIPGSSLFLSSFPSQSSLREATLLPPDGLTRCVGARLLVGFSPFKSLSTMRV
jgi:hypothetical protein